VANALEPQPEVAQSSLHARRRDAGLLPRQRTGSPRHLRSGADARTSFRRAEPERPSSLKGWPGW
jgi:hypothetical protein